MSSIHTKSNMDYFNVNRLLTMREIFGKTYVNDKFLKIMSKNNYTILAPIYSQDEIKHRQISLTNNIINSFKALPFEDKDSIWFLLKCSHKNIMCKHIRYDACIQLNTCYFKEEIDYFMTNKNNIVIDGDMGILKNFELYNECMSSNCKYISTCKM